MDFLSVVILIGTFITAHFWAVVAGTAVAFIIGLMRESYFLVGTSIGFGFMLPIVHQYGM